MGPWWQSRSVRRRSRPEGEAKHELQQLMASGSVHCEDRGHDRHGRTISLCRSGKQDLGAAMVSAGMAWAFTRYSSDYINQEREANGSRRGVHAHDCEKAWNWRAQSR
jgi:endonuclease YncB( thermonuclease family)